MTDGSFDAGWLALRRPYDHAARDNAAWQACRDWAATRDRLRIVDLGAGSGSNLAFMAERLEVAQDWVLVDSDPALLEAAARQAHPQATVSTREADLAKADLGELISGADLVTAAALLDLVSADWVARLVGACRDQAVALLATLTVDRRLDWQPALANDTDIAAAFHRDLQRDKGFGPGLGPDAAALLVELLGEAGLAVTRATSDWALGPGDEAMAEALIGFYADAADRAPSLSPTKLSTWRTARQQSLKTNAWSHLVGHVDVFARPAEIT